MNPKWTVFILMAWIAISLLVGVAENALVGGAMDSATGLPMQTSVLNDLLTSKLGGTFWSAIGNMATFNFPGIFYGSWAIFRWIFFLVLGIAFMLSLGLALIRGVSSG